MTPDGILFDYYPESKLTLLRSTETQHCTTSEYGVYMYDGDYLVLVPEYKHVRILYMIVYLVSKVL